MRNDIPKRRAKRLARKLLRHQWMFRGNEDALILAAVLNLEIGQ